MRFEEALIKAQEDMKTLSTIMTDNEEYYMNHNMCYYVEDLEDVLLALAEDYERGYEDRQEDINSFLDRHGIFYM